MTVYRAECVTELGSNPSEPERGRTHASAHMHRVTMNVYRRECVTELGPNRSEPEAREASVGRTYASAHKQLIGGTADRTFLTITQKVFVVEKK